MRWERRSSWSDSLRQRFGSRVHWAVRYRRSWFAALRRRPWPVSSEKAPWAPRTFDRSSPEVLSLQTMTMTSTSSLWTGRPSQRSREESRLYADPEALGCATEHARNHIRFRLIRCWPGLPCAAIWWPVYWKDKRVCRDWLLEEPETIIDQADQTPTDDNYATSIIQHLLWWSISRAATVWMKSLCGPAISELHEEEIVAVETWQFIMLQIDLQRWQSKEI